MYNGFDLVFFLGSLLAVLVVGFWNTRRQKDSVNDYFRGGNRLPYAQDIWAPMAAPVVVVFLCGALWKRADSRGAVLCLWLWWGIFAVILGGVYWYFW